MFNNHQQAYPIDPRRQQGPPYGDNSQPSLFPETPQSFFPASQRPHQQGMAWARNGDGGIFDNGSMHQELFPARIQQIEPSFMPADAQAYHSYDQISPMDNGWTNEGVHQNRMMPGYQQYSEGPSKPYRIPFANGVQPETNTEVQLPANPVMNSSPSLHSNPIEAQQAADSHPKPGSRQDTATPGLSDKAADLKARLILSMSKARQDKSGIARAEQQTTVNPKLASKEEVGSSKEPKLEIERDTDISASMADLDGLISESKAAAEASEAKIKPSGNSRNDSHKLVPNPPKSTSFNATSSLDHTSSSQPQQMPTKDLAKPAISKPKSAQKLQGPPSQPSAKSLLPAKPITSSIESASNSIFHISNDISSGEISEIEQGEIFEDNTKAPKPTKLKVSETTDSHKRRPTIAINSNQQTSHRPAPKAVEDKRRPYAEADHPSTQASSNTPKERTREDQPQPSPRNLKETSNALPDRPARASNEKSVVVYGDRPMADTIRGSAKGREVTRRSFNLVEPNEERDTGAQRYVIEKEAPTSLVKPKSDPYYKDLDEWLEMTGYHQVTYRKKALQGYKELQALEARRAAIEREVQEAQEEPVYFSRASSMMPRDNFEVSSTRITSAPKVFRPFQSLSMLPPPVPEHPSHSRDATIFLRQEPQSSILQAGSTSQRRTYAEREAEIDELEPSKKLARISHQGRSSTRLDPENEYVQARVSRGSENDRDVSARITRDNTDNHEGRDSSQRRHRDSVACGRLGRPASPAPDMMRRRSASPPLRRDDSMMMGESLRSARSPLLSYSRESSPIRRSRGEAYYHEDGRNYNQRRYGETSFHSRQFEAYPRQGRFNRVGSNGSSFNIRGGHNGFSERNSSKVDRHDLHNGVLTVRLPETRYFIVKSFNSENVEKAQEDNIWATQEKNAELFSEAYQTCQHVILIFSINKSTAFQGYARMASAPGTAEVPSWSKHLLWKSSGPFHIEWITIAETKFNRIGHLKNAYNEHQAVLIGRDGQEIEPHCGADLCALIDEEAERNNRLSMT
ncbi:MAG: hypothetical protein M1829_003323 [Trizodia sp. TS-e1964]|nr:MAG: hypothetical protein M1829_003323 [Trizodia sp. TS-e1964]